MAAALILPRNLTKPSKSILNATIVNFSGNNTNDEVWTANTIISLVTLITGFTSNSFVLWIFAKKPSLRTPFNIYLINLLISNMCMITLQYPFDIASSFSYPGWSYGTSACTLYVYALWTIEAVQANSHQLIAINRLWAVLNPLSYRTYHSVRVAISLCLGMWLCIHIATLPMIIADTAFYQHGIPEHGCSFNATAQRTYDITLNLVVFIWPEIVLWMVFPIVQVAKIIRKRSGVGPVIAGNRVSTPGISQQGSLVKASVSMVRPSDGQSNTRSGTVASKGRGHTTALLAFLTVAVTVCWTPLNAFFLLKVFIPGFARGNQAFLFTSLALYSVETTVDPIVFVLAMRPLRNAVLEVFRGGIGRAR